MSIFVVVGNPGALEGTVSAENTTSLAIVLLGLLVLMFLGG
jgi:hypothetical protein